MRDPNAEPHVRLEAAAKAAPAYQKAEAIKRRAAGETLASIARSLAGQEHTGSNVAPRRWRDAS